MSDRGFIFDCPFVIIQKSHFYFVQFTSMERGITNIGSVSVLMPTQLDIYQIPNIILVYISRIQILGFFLLDHRYYHWIILLLVIEIKKIKRN